MQSKHLTTFKTKECMTTNSYMEMSFYHTHTHKHTTDTYTHTFVWDIIWFSLELCRWERPNLNSDILTLNLRFTLLQPYVHVWIAHTCLTLCNPVDCSLQGSFVHGILQARILEQVAISSSRRSSHPGIKPRSLALQAGSLPSESPGKPITAIYRKLTFYGRRKMILTQLEWSKPWTIWNSVSLSNSPGWQEALKKCQSSSFSPLLFFFPSPASIFLIFIFLSYFRRTVMRQWE